MLSSYNKVAKEKKTIRKIKYIYSIYGKKSVDKWTHTIQTHFVQGSIVITNLKDITLGFCM